MQKTISTSSLSIHAQSGAILISTETLTIDAICTSHRQIHLIYTDKHGNLPNYIPVAMKPGGCALGTIFEKTPLKVGNSPKRWLGKVGQPSGLFNNDPSTLRTRKQKDINLDGIREKIASDLYEVLGGGFFKLPKTRLSEQDIANDFMPAQMPISMMGIVSSVKTSLRIMSKYVQGYSDFSKAFVLDSGKQISFIDFIKINHAPPTHLLTSDGKEVPLIGFMEMVAAARLLADTDVLGGRCDNAGFIWIEENGTITHAQTVKIDPGCAFRFTHDLQDSCASPNWVFNTYYKLAHGTMLNDVKDLQMAQQYKPITLCWGSLASSQRQAFLKIILSASRYLQAPELLEFLIYRKGAFHKHDKATFPKSLADRFRKEMEDWLRFQLEIYQEDLQILGQTLQPLKSTPHTPVEQFSVTFKDLSQRLITLINHPLVKKDTELLAALSSQRKNFADFNKKDLLLEDHLAFYLLLGGLLTTNHQVDISVRQKFLNSLKTEKASTITEAFLKGIHAQIQNQEFQDAWKNLLYYPLPLDTPRAVVQEYGFLANTLLPHLPFSEKKAILTQLIPALNQFPNLAQEQAILARTLALWFLSHKDSISQKKDSKKFISLP